MFLLYHEYAQFAQESVVTIFLRKFSEFAAAHEPYDIISFFSITTV